MSRAGFRKKSSDDAGPWMNRVFKAVFSSEVHLMRWMRFPIGLSIYAIASR